MNNKTKADKNKHSHEKKNNQINIQIKKDEKSKIIQKTNKNPFVINKETNIDGMEFLGREKKSVKRRIHNKKVSIRVKTEGEKKRESWK